MKKEFYYRAKYKHLRKLLFLCLVILLCFGTSNTFAQITTIDFENMGLSEGAKPAHPWTYDGFIFDLGAGDVGTSGFTFYAGNGEGGTNSMTVEYGNKTVTELIITKSGGGEFAFHGIWLKKYFGSDTVNIQGWLGDSRIGNQLNFNIATGNTFTASPAWNVDKIVIRGNIDLDFDNFQYGDPISPNTTPTISINDNTLFYTENNAATLIDATASVNDSDGDADWDGGGLTVQVTANSESADEISISDTDGDGTAITISGTNLLANGTDIGDLTASGGVVTGGTMLSIVFDSDATNANVQEVLQSLRYRNTSDDPGTANKTITINATDKNAANSSDTRTISIIAVNDEPVLISTGLNPTFTEGESAVSLFQSTSASTVESGQTFSDLTITVSNVNNGSNERLNVDGTTIVLTNGTSGTTAGNSLGYNVSVSGTITTVNFSGGTLSTLSLQTLIDAISYQNNSNSPNTANRTVIITSIKDSGGTANSGDDTAALSVNSTVTVVAVNDKPTGANFTANSIYKGTSYVFSTSDFGFTDIDGDIMTKIAVNLVPHEGILYVDADNDDDYDAGEELANADNVTKADLDNGNLQYYNDTGINSYFEFAVYDGTAYSASTYTATLNIIAFPTVTTQAVSSITATTATGNGNINDLGIPNPTAHGVCWSTSENPTTADSKDDKGAASATGAYTASITGLTAGTTYYARAFATNNAGTVYGSQVSFTTNTPPTVKNRTFTDIHKGNIYPNIGNIAIDYEDDGGNNLQNIRILSLPGNGTLFLDPDNNNKIDDGEAVVVNQLVSRDHLNWAYLKYLNTDGVSSSFTYEASDGTDYSNTATVTLNVKATPRVTFTNIAQTISEATETITITVQLSEVINYAEVTVPFSVDGSSSATSGGVDYSITGSPIKIIAGSTSNTITITVSNDDLDEPDETVIVNMGEPTNAIQGATSTFTANIIDNDLAPTVSFNTENSERSESISSTDLQVNLSAASGYPVSVDYVVQGTSTATGSGTDYTLANGTLSFAEGETSKNISISDIIDDTLDEEDETIEVILTNPNNASLGTKQTHTYTILDNDDPPTVSFTTESQVSSNESGTMQITAELSEISGRDVSVDFSVNETSTASRGGIDYSIENSPLNFAAGSTSADITIAISMDMLDESDETVIVDMVNLTNATQGTIQSHTVSIKDDDHTPIITANQTFDIDENKDNNVVIGTVLASDEDAGTSFSQWLIVGGNDDGIFTINTTSGVISIADNTNLDFERTESYALSITVSDGVNTSLPENVRIDINDLNDNIPVVTASQTFDVDENKDNNAVVGTVLASDLDAGTSFSQWLIVSGNDDGIFAINTTSGEISIADNTNLDFEQTESYTLSITVSDGSNTSLAENVRIDINDLNDNIPVVTANQTFNVDENKANNTIIGTVIATDNDAGTSFSAWKITAGNTDGIFELNASSGEISIADNTNLDYETTTSYTLSLTVSDGTNISASETINIDVNPINDITPVITCCQGFNLVENVDNGTKVGTVSVSDADTGDDEFYTDWTIVSGNEDGIFKIDENSGEITVFDNTYLDYERDGSHNLILTVSDGLHTSAEENVQIQMYDENDNAPVIANGQSFNVDENASNSTSVGTVSATDADLNTHYTDWTITGGNTDGIFAINAASGEISIADNTNLDFEQTESYTLSITVSDGSNTSLAENVRIDINDLNDNIPVIVANQTFNVDENKANNTIIGTVMATDNDAGTSFSAWKITAGNTDGIFELNASSGEISIADNTNLDFETTTSYALSITVSDGINTSLAENIRVKINDLNDNIPVVTAGQNFGVDENSANNTAVGIVLATDADAQSTFSQWTIVDGNEDSIFTIDAVTGEISIADNSNLDFEKTASFTLLVTVSDGLNISTAESLIISLNDINDVQPVITPAQVYHIAENSEQGVVVATIDATDGDVNPSNFTFAWSSNDGNINSAFVLEPSTGKIKINKEGAIDREQFEKFELMFTVSDGVNTSVPEKVIVVLDDQNEFAPIISEGQRFDINENSKQNTIVGTVNATDGDISSTLSNWKITRGNEDGIFSIGESNGMISIADNTKLDYEAITNYSLQLTVSDGEKISTAQNISINVMNVNDNVPSITPNQSFTIHENLHNGNGFAVISAIDKDHDAELTNWKIISGNELNAFRLNSDDGYLYVNNSSLLDREKVEFFEITVSTSDGEHTSEPEVIKILLKDLNDNRPVIATNQSFSLDENPEENEIIGKILVSDADVSPTTYRNWMITNMLDFDNNGNNAIKIDQDNGNLLVNDPADFDCETNASFTIKVKVSDGTDFGAEETITINLKDINEYAPVVTENQEFNIEENASENTAIGVLSATDKDIETSLSQWTITDGNEANIFMIDPSSGEITLANNENLDFEINQAHILSVTVSDGMYSSEQQNVSIKVIDVNEAPVANVGDDQMVAGNVLVTLDGSNSTDPENDELTYHWTAPEGITLSDVNSAQPTFTSPILNQNKDFTFTLVVNDGEFDSEEVTTTINVELTTGVDDLNPIVEQVLLYPNPTKGAFNLSFGENPTGGVLVIISNVNGQVFHQERIYEKVKQFNKSLAPGMYLVKIMYQNNVCTRKLLIQ
ncbi:cadherin domain-containing protein [Marinifilum flexuosum]|uniref:Putative secreted protein (Por secretion system target) n=1 Tax=Marinifilum flexuosum TaxID=1117708 RepID=A0A419X6Q3_9BACT|nr:cadherin domain-containing protein [Marinifilum flexuosum]RKE03279.1 putative secreted protein (Por secretion system target) [Marinifilum flexuosum]